jgi:hypothetical protein
MRQQYWILVFLCIILTLISVNCISTDHSKQFKYYNYTYNHSASQNVTVDLRASVLGATPIWILESSSNNIELIVYYMGEPRVKFIGDNKNLYVNMDVAYPTDAWNVSAKIFLYLPNNANYSINIRNDAVDFNSVWKDESKTTIGNFTGPILIDVNNQTMVKKYDGLIL